MDCRDLESLGADRVRLRIQAGLWPAEYMELALDWLALKEAEAARHRDAFQAAREAAREAKAAREERLFSAARSGVN